MPVWLDALDADSLGDATEAPKKDEVEEPRGGREGKVDESGGAAFGRFGRDSGVEVAGVSGVGVENWADGGLFDEVGG